MDYSKISDNLYIGRTPKKKDYTLLHELGVRLVINMRIGTPPRRDPDSMPIRSIWLPWVDSPFLPIPVPFLEFGTREALKVIDEGGAVYTHCAKGRHRGPAMAACILIAQGLSAEQAMQLIKQQRPVSDPRVWYIRRQILKFEQEWRKRQNT